MRSASWLTSSRELEVMKASPSTEVPSSTRNGATRCPPLLRINDPLAQESSTARRTLASSPSRKFRSSTHGRRSSPTSRPSSSE